MSNKSFLKQAARAVIWILAVSIPVVTAIFIAGPDAIRNFPKVPGAIRETAHKVLYQAWLDKQLTGKWDNQSYLGDMPPDLLAVELWVDDGVVDGTISAPDYIGRWRPEGLPRDLPAYHTALLRGKTEGNSLKVEVFDFVDAKTVKFANLTIWFSEEDLGDFSAPTPDDDITQLRIETEWEVSPGLPTSFVVSRAGK